MRMASARKTPTNLSVREDLVRRARALGLNLSEILETALERMLREAERAQWEQTNRDAIDSYNERVEKDGVFGDHWRKF